MLKHSTLAFVAAFAGATSMAAAQAQQTAPSIGFFDWDTNTTTSFPDFAPSPFLTNSNVNEVKATLNAAQAAGKTLAIKINQPISDATAKAIFNNYSVKYVFCDFESAQAVGQTRGIADLLVANGSQSSGAFIGNFNFYPNSGSDGTRPNGGATPSAGTSFSNNPFNTQYSSIKGQSATKAGKTMANESLYPGSPDFRNPAQGNSNAPNIRSALFTLPILRAGNVTSSLPSGDANIPWVARFNNYGNAALDTDGNPSNGYQFVQSASDPTTGQLPSRGDFQAQILHYRLRGATSVNMFEGNDQPGQMAGSVVGYTRAQSRSDIRTGWSNAVTANQIFARGKFALANLGSTVNVFTSPTSTAAPQTVSSESAGVLWSGVYDTAAASGTRALAVLISNMSGTDKEIDLPTIGGSETYNPNDVRRDDYLVPAGTHRLLTFTFASNRWNLSSSNFRFTDNYRNGVGIPEPTTAAVLGVGALGLLTRRRRSV